VDPNSDVVKLRVRRATGYFCCSSDGHSCSIQGSEGRNVIPRRILIFQQGRYNVSRRRAQRKENKYFV